MGAVISVFTFLLSILSYTCLNYPASGESIENSPEPSAIPQYYSYQKDARVAIITPAGHNSPNNVNLPSEKYQRLMINQPERLPSAQQVKDWGVKIISDAKSVNLQVYHLSLTANSASTAQNYLQISADSENLSSPNQEYLEYLLDRLVLDHKLIHKIADLVAEQVSSSLEKHLLKKLENNLREQMLVAQQQVMQLANLTTKINQNNDQQQELNKKSDAKFEHYDTILSNRFKNVECVLASVNTTLTDLKHSTVNKETLESELGIWCKQLTELDSKVEQLQTALQQLEKHQKSALNLGRFEQLKQILQQHYPANESAWMQWVSGKSRLLQLAEHIVREVDFTPEGWQAFSKWLLETSQQALELIYPTEGERYLPHPPQKLHKSVGFKPRTTGMAGRIYSCERPGLRRQISTEPESVDWEVVLPASVQVTT